MGADPELPTDFEKPRVDPGALALATVAGAVAFILGPGEWDLLAVVIGLMLVFILLAHHRRDGSVVVRRGRAAGDAGAQDRALAGHSARQRGVDVRGQMNRTPTHSASTLATMAIGTVSSPSTL